MLKFLVLTITILCLNKGKPVDCMEYKLFNRDCKDVILSGSAEEYGKFIKDLPCKFVTHGWLQEDQSNSVQNVKNNYLKCLDVNVITLDWSDRYNLEYYSSIDDTASVGEALGNKMLELVKAGVCKPETTHCVGHSLGAHVCGSAGKKFQSTKGKNISRVTGLDPAGPGYEINLLHTPTMSSSDADFVDAIHTSTYFGFDGTLGKVDFYVNSGQPRQPGCLLSLNVICSHSRSHELYAESICDRNAFKSTQCDSYEKYQSGRCQGNPTVHMGEHCPDRYAGLIS